MSIKNVAEEALYINIKTVNGRLVEPVAIMNSGGRVCLVTHTETETGQTHIMQYDDVPTDEDTEARQKVIDSLEDHPSTYNISTH